MPLVSASRGIVNKFLGLPFSVCPSGYGWLAVFICTFVPWSWKNSFQLSLEKKVIHCSQTNEATCGVCPLLLGKPWWQPLLYKGRIKTWSGMLESWSTTLGWWTCDFERPLIKLLSFHTCWGMGKSCKRPIAAGLLVSTLFLWPISHIFIYSLTAVFMPGQ